MNKSKLLFLAFIVFTLASIYPAAADVSFSVNPMKLQMNTLPGRQSSAHIEVTNLSSDKTVNIFIKKADLLFRKDNSIGFLRPSKKNTTAAWLSFDKQELSIKPHESKIITAIIKVPSSAGFAEHYAAILFETKPVAIKTQDVSKGEQTGVKVGSRIASLVVQNSPGHQLLSGRITSFAIPRLIVIWPGRDNSFQYRASFKNTGNTHFDFMGEAFIKNSNGDVVFTKNYGNQTAIAGTEKNYSDKVLKKLPAGVYDASLRVTYAGGKAVQTDKTFIVIQIKTFIIIAITLVFFCIAGILFSNKFIIKRRSS